MHSLREQLLAIQRATYRKNLKLIERSLTSDASLERYSREYHANLRRYNEVSSKGELIRRVLSSDIVYHGDYHPLKQSQRSVLRILREIVEKRQIILCLEMFHHEDQRFVDQFMHNELTQKEFIGKIRFIKKWSFKWEYWKPIISLCKEFGIRVIGTNSEPQDRKNTLRQRDLFAAKVIAKLAIQNPCTLLYVVDGDYHISPNHLPSHVEKLCKVFDLELKRTIIYQNDATLYWQLAHDHKEEANVLQVTEDSFCIMNTTPANKLQSYLNWLELSEDAYYPVEPDWEVSEETGYMSIPGIVKTICAILELPYPEDAVQRLEIYYGGDLDFMGILERSAQLAAQLPTVRQKIKNDEAFLLEYEKDGEDSYLIYLPNSSLNMASEEATHFLNAVMRKRLRVRLKPFDMFYWTVMTETLGFFGSKLINEKRKCQSRNSIRRYLGSFKQKAASGKEKINIQLCHLILQHRFLENITHHPADFKDKFDAIYHARTKIPLGLATQLGYMLGDKLFYAVKKRLFPLRDILDLFKEPFAEPFSAFITYLNISAKVARRKIHKPQE